MPRSPFTYRWRGGALLRASTDPGGLDLPDDVDLFEEGGLAAGKAWAARVWARNEVRDAMGMASPALCRRIEDVLSGECPDERRARKALVSLASYLLRWQRRPTPFGLFAGVAVVQVTNAPRVVWGGDHQVLLRTDAEWLTDVIDRLHRCRELRHRLRVVTNDTARARGDRIVAPGPPTNGRTHHMAPIEVSVRRTGPVTAALEIADSPFPYAELRARLAERFPTAGDDRIAAVLDGLLTQNLLITSLWPPMTHLDTLGHVCAELDSVGAHDIDEIAPLVKDLYAVRDDLTGHGTTASAPERAHLVERMRNLSDIAPVPLVVDTALDCEVHVPERLVREAEEAVGVLYRLTPHRFGYPQWRDYHARFRARYGPGAVVPVEELVADSGLGLPAGYLGSAHRRAARQVQDRDETILALVQQALLEGSEEIVLTRRVVDELADDDGADPMCAPRIEVSVQVCAPSVEALTQGRFRLVVTGAPRPGSSMAGRATHLLPERERDRLAATYRVTDDAVAAQLSFAPRRRRNDNVARTTQLLEHVIPLGEHREPARGIVPLSDLAVTADARRFDLVQLSTGRRVEPRVTHALEAGVHTPPLARFLAELTTARCAVYRDFDFGVATYLPYLPRVRYRDTVLFPARWLLDRHDLPGPSATAQDWEAALAAWRIRLRVPERVAVVEHDQRLPLDLSHPLHRRLLRSRLDAHPRLELRETTTAQELGWIGRPHELLLVLTHTGTSALEPVRRTASIRSPPSSTAHLPGRSPVLYAQVHAHPHRYDEILTHHLPPLLHDLEAPRWWFGRHRDLLRPDADQYLELYVRLVDEDVYGWAAEQAHDWAEGLRDARLVSGLTLATHEPQTGRYGHGPVMDAAEAVFSSDSAAALAQIHTAEKAGHDGQALAAASMVDLSASFATSPEQGMSWLVEHLPRQPGRVDRRVREQARALVERPGDHTRLRSLPGGQDVADAWETRAEALASYREHLAVERDPLAVLRSLLHQHHVRALGVDPDRERATTALARSCALGHLAHRTEVQ
ncbi:lantibiotic dehydratase family protein [Nocardiopsis sp. EMB25]|uniref:lantibiotic dehydratase n=1 Tax=Nocardiopsis sp. EMB25 TaxID=2835867 RepID=UPI0022852D3D|nr:lantibiotic dehydratase [Nocardiopsis sp. EMB25]MCY9784958.1 lantibiotic dehydratase family protein [Nocardiopsis sp. EMB25]